MKTCKGACGVSICFTNSVWVIIVRLLAEGAEILYSVSLAEENKSSGARVIQSCGSTFEGFPFVVRNQPQKGRAKRAVATDFCG